MNERCDVYLCPSKSDLEMYTNNWQVIRDDRTHTFEVCGQEGNTNAFTNKTYAMQRDGMNVSCVLLPVSNRNASKTPIKITGYTTEAGLWQRLQDEHQAIIRQRYTDLDEDESLSGF